MNGKRSLITVKTSQLSGILLEKYAYTAGTVEPLPKHSHQEYQLGMSFNCQGEYYYRGAYHPIPTGSLSMIHSGEVHSPSQRTYLPQPATFWMMHIDPSLLEQKASEINSNVRVPFFTEPIIGDRYVAKLFYNSCLAIQTDVSKLARDSAILYFFAALISYRAKLVSKSEPTEKQVIAIVCNYLQDNYQQNVSLTELADLVGLSCFHLSRSFHRQKGISLSAYQVQIRIDRAKRFLSQGLSISEVATMTGFYDQSHFGDRFKRLVGTTPGNYQKEQ